MRKNKGFTLIELLAVIVILAIIAVITVPKVAEMIQTAREGGAEDSFYGTIKSAELAWSQGLKANKNLAEATCTASGSTLNCAATADSNITFTTTISGTAPESGTIKLSSDGAASVESESPLLFNGYDCTGNSSSVTCVKHTESAGG